MHELLAAAAHLPDSVVGLGQCFVEPPEDPQGKGLGLTDAMHPELARPVDGIDQLAVDVELQLPRRSVADPHRRGALVAGQVRQLVLVEAPLATEAVHDLDVLRVAGHRPDNPVAPCGRLLDVAGSHERVERERGVAQPAEPVVPVADAAEELRQRRRGRGDDPTARGVDQRLEGDQRPLHLVRPPAGVRRASRPLLPPRVGRFGRGERIDRLRRVLPRRTVGEHEPHPLALPAP